MTHTFAVLGVSQAAYDEIKTKLEAAGYGHAFINQTINMHGIGLVAEATPAPSCAGCRFYSEDPKPSSTSDLGECRRYAPRVGGPFPLLMNTDWCGEFETKSVPIDLMKSLAKDAGSDN